MVLLLLIIVPLIVIGVLDYRNASDASAKLFGTSNLFAVLPPNEIKNTNGRTNILLIGYSADDPGHAGAELTDSIMLVSLDKDSASGYMVSIPRDLYVDIPDYGYGKINEAYQAGERQDFAATGYSPGGAGLLEKVVTDTLGVPIHYHIIINYAAVREITDALGGITITIASSDPRGIYDPNFKLEEGGPLKLANGQHTIDGQTALRLTRARGATYGSYGFPQSDFNRTEHQQKVFAAIKSELSPALLLDPRTNKQVFDAAADNLRTNIDIDALLPLFQLFRSVPEDSLSQVNLRDVGGDNLLASYTTASGQSALIPAAGIDDYSQIQDALAAISR